MNELNKKEYLDKIRGCLIGAAAGDALGYTIKDMDQMDILKRYGKEGITAYDKKSDKAKISSNTQIMLFTANAVLFTETQTEIDGIYGDICDNLYYAYQDWLKTQDISYSSLQNTEGYNEEYGFSWLLEVPELYSNRDHDYGLIFGIIDMAFKIKYGTVIIEDYRKEPFKKSENCGGLVSILPVALDYKSDTKEIDNMALQVAAVFHGKPRGYLPAAVLSHIINKILVSKGSVDLNDIILDARKTILDCFCDEEEKDLYEIITLIDKVIELSRDDIDDLYITELLGDGYIANEALAISLYFALKYQNDFSKAICAAVNHSGNSNATGMITGSILGTLYGYKYIDDKWKNKLELKDIILQLADDLYYRYQLNYKWLKKYDGLHKCMPKKDNSHLMEKIEAIENILKQKGLHCLGDSFGNEMLECNIPAKHVFVEKCGEKYYVSISNLDYDIVQIKYYIANRRQYRLLCEIDTNLPDEKIEKLIEKMLFDGLHWQRKILNKYISIEEEDFYLLEATANKYEEFIDDGINLILFLYEFLYEVQDIFEIDDLIKLGMDFYRRCLNKYGKFHPTTMYSIFVVAMGLIRENEIEHAILLCKYLYKCFEKQYGKNSRPVAHANGALCNYYFLKNRNALAEHYAKNCIDFYQSKGDIKSVLKLKYYIAQQNKYDRGTAATSLKYEFELYDILKEKEEIDNNTILELRSDIAISYCYMENYEMALEIQRSVVVEALETKCAEDNDIFSYVIDLSNILSRAGKDKEAYEFDSSLVYNCKKHFGHEHEFTITAKDFLLDDLLQLGMRDKAMALAYDEYLWRKSIFGEEHQFTQHVWQFYIGIEEERF